MHTERQLEKKFGELRNKEKHFVVPFLAMLAFACSWLLASYSSIRILKNNGVSSKLSGQNIKTHKGFIKVVRTTL